MKKSEAVRLLVERDLAGVPTEWVRIVAESDHEYPNLPMWGTMFIVEDFIGEQLMGKSRVMQGEASDIYLDDIPDEDEREAVRLAIEALQEDRISWGETALLEKYVDEEMAGERCILDKDGNTTGIYLYQIGGEYVLGVNGAGFNFYEHVWPSLYDTLGLRWHSDNEVAALEDIKNCGDCRISLCADHEA